MIRHLICQKCSELKPETAELRGHSLWKWGTLAVSRPSGDVTVTDLSTGIELYRSQPTQLYCDWCGAVLRQGDSVCCYSYWIDSAGRGYEPWEAEVLSSIKQVRQYDW